LPKITASPPGKPGTGGAGGLLVGSMGNNGQP